MGEDGAGRGHHVAIFVIAFASLLLEIAYTRVISFKLFYYYTYLVIGLALLGIGAGGVLVAVSRRLQRASTEAVLVVGSLVGAVSVAAGYLVVARLPIASLAIWRYGTRASAVSLTKLVLLCLVLFASFVAVGTMIATLFGRRTEGIGRLYCADLVGAGLACALAVPLLSAIGPPRTIVAAGALLALVAVGVAWGRRPAWAGVSGVVAAALAVGVLSPTLLPDVRTDDQKSPLLGAVSSHWSPIFRVDALGFPDQLMLMHDGLLGSIIKRWDGSREQLATFGFESDPRSLPFDTLGSAPGRVMIIGAAGGHEVLVSLDRDAEQIDAIELNPETHDLVTDEFADFDGNLADQPGVDYRHGDGRSFLARSDDAYDLVWYPAPDSYSATNAATAGAFVLSESYLYTTETIQESLDHLTADGIVAAQFGEADFDRKPNRTARYLATVRDALEARGVEDPGAHVLVATTGLEPPSALSTVLVKSTPFTAEEVARLTASAARVPGSAVRYAPGAGTSGLLTDIATLPPDELDDLLADQPYDLAAISDDGPFFWHFARFGDVVANLGDPIGGPEGSVDTEDAIGERVLLLLLAIAAVFAAVFLLLPFVAVRDTWRRLPRKGTSAMYFATLGLGFMFFEITLIQRLILFLGYPTYSLTVTLASLLVSTGCGALLSARWKDRVGAAIPWLAGAVVALGVLYLVVLPRVTTALLDTALGVRVAVAFVVLAPLGLCLGMFMPLGLGCVARLTPHSSEYVAWGWAVNGFASVIGSVLTTLVAMTVGFGWVLALATATYLAALVILWRLQRAEPVLDLSDDDTSAVPGYSPAASSAATSSASVTTFTSLPSSADTS